jgi:hypothetical protein
MHVQSLDGSHSGKQNKDSWHPSLVSEAHGGGQVERTNGFSYALASET